MSRCLSNLLDFGEVFVCQFPLFAGVEVLDYIHASLIASRNNQNMSFIYVYFISVLPYLF